jgi:3-oxoacyl-[acyl-carrier protein] reductase
MRTIRGRKALVTGAADGIGRAIALELARAGADLFLIDINAEGLAAVADEARGHGVEAIAVVCDLAESAEVSAAVARLRAAWNGLDILVNNAGLAYYGPMHLMTDAQWHRIMAVNLLAPIQLVRELLPTLLAADEAHVLNVSSMFGLTGWRKALAYQTTKFGLVGFTAGLRAEYCCNHFGVTALCPGFVLSALTTNYATVGPHERRRPPSWVCATPEKVAARALRAIKRNQGMVVMTPLAHVYWRLWRLLPGAADWLLREGWRRRGRIDPGEGTSPPRPSVSSPRPAGR